MQTSAFCHLCCNVGGENTASYGISLSFHSVNLISTDRCASAWRVWLGAIIVSSNQNAKLLRARKREEISSCLCFLHVYQDNIRKSTFL